MSDSVQPHGWQPTRLPCPGDSPGMNTGVGHDFLLQCVKVKSERKSLSRVRLLATPWTAAYQAPPSMGFSRQEYWSGVPLPSPLHTSSCSQMQSIWDPMARLTFCKHCFHQLSQLRHVQCTLFWTDESRSISPVCLRHFHLGKLCWDETFS